jgi:hypothetical protein
MAGDSQAMAEWVGGCEQTECWTDGAVGVLVTAVAMSEGRMSDVKDQGVGGHRKAGEGLE